MSARRHPTRRYIELTTLSLLRREGEWRRFGEHLSQGGVLIVIPRDSGGTWKCLLRAARRFQETGREVKICYYPQG